MKHESRSGLNVCILMLAFQCLLRGAIMLLLLSIMTIRYTGTFSQWELWSSRPLPHVMLLKTLQQKPD